MKLFRLKGKHDDPDAEKELVLDTGTADDSAPEPQSSLEPESAPPVADEAVEIASNEEEAPPPPPEDNLLAQISAQADKEMAEQEELAAGATSPDDDTLDPSLLDIFKDAKTEVEEGSLAADLEDIPAREVLEEMRAISRGLGIPAGGVTGRHDDQAGELVADEAQRQAEEGGPETEPAEPHAEADVVQADGGPDAEVAEERPPLTQAH
jgi:hypothetical protein